MSILHYAVYLTDENKYTVLYNSSKATLLLQQKGQKQTYLHKSHKQVDGL